MNLVRHAIEPTFSLATYADAVRQRYSAWLLETNADATFTPEQREWLDRMAEHIATSLEISRRTLRTAGSASTGAEAGASSQTQDLLAPLQAPRQRAYYRADLGG